nr:protein NYNRIN-like [Tanacetum cinerariifolium]
MKRVIMDLPSLTPRQEKETLYAYLAVSVEAVSAVLLTDKKGRQFPVQYVSRTLNEAERNYAPMEKLALSFIHMTRILRIYFKAHPVKVITDQPIKNILNNTETSRKLAKYVVELGAYTIKFIPRNAMKGQVQADFLSEAPEGTKEDLYFRMPNATVEKDDTESWTLFTDGVSSPNGSGAGLVLIGPSSIKYTYALRLTFPSTNNEAENMNQKADVLSKLASVAFNHLTKEVLVEVLNERSTEGQEVHTIVEEERDKWMTPIIQCLEEGIWPKDKNEARCLRAKIGQYTIESDVLFKKGYLVPMLRYAGPLQANYVIREIHMGSCDMHVGPCAVVKKVWGMDILGPLSPARGKAKFIIVAIDYFTKWIEAKPLVKITGYNEEEMRLNLDMLQERREAAAVREARYKTKMEQYYNRKVRPAGFRPGEFVYRRNKASRVEDQGKLGPKWERPYKVADAYENGSYKLQTLKDKEAKAQRQPITYPLSGNQKGKPTHKKGHYPPHEM